MKNLREIKKQNLNILQEPITYLTQ